MKMRKLGIGAVLLALSIFMSACGAATTKDASGSGSASKGEVIKVASVTPLSGSQAALGESIKNGAQLALEERVEEFKAMGMDLQFTPQDDQADPKVGVTVAQKLIADNDVVAVVGHWNSGVAIPSSEVYKKGNLTMVSPANTAVAVTERGLDNVNRIVTRDDVQGPAGADYCFNELGCKTAFVIQDKTTYGQGVADEFKKRFEEDGGTSLGYEGITAGESDFSAVLNKVAATKPDVVYFGGIYPEGSLIIKQMREKGVEAKFMGPDGMDSGEILKIAGDSAKGALYTSMAADISGTDEGKKFNEKYQAKFSKAPEGYAAYGYDAMNVALNGIATVVKANGNKKPDKLEIIKAVRATKDFKGIATTVTFNAKGDNTEANVYVFQFTDELKYPPAVVKAISAKDYVK